MAIFNDDLFLTVQGYAPGEGDDLIAEVIQIRTGELLRILPDLVRCINSEFVNEIENTKNPFHGWQVVGLEIAHPDNAPDIEGRDIEADDGGAE